MASSGEKATSLHHGTRRRFTGRLPIIDRFADWLAEQQAVALPKSGFGQAVNYARNQTHTPNALN